MGAHILVRGPHFNGLSAHDEKVADMPVDAPIPSRKERSFGHRFDTAEVPAASGPLGPLVIEAERHGRRRVASQLAAARIEARARRYDPEKAKRLKTRLERRAMQSQIAFHRSIDVLVHAGGFDEAIALLGRWLRTTGEPAG